MPGLFLAIFPEKIAVFCVPGIYTCDMATKKITWEKYLSKTSSQRPPKTDAAFRHARPTPATKLRWAGQDRLLFGDTIINGKYTGRKLSSLSLTTLQQLLSQATGKQDRDILTRHLEQISLGPEPGAPVDPKTLHKA
jgi:hypothetical protein